MNLQEIFANRITQAIKNNNITQKSLAKKLNISESNITNWKKGQNLPSIEILRNLCIILDEKSDYLLGLEDEIGSKTYNNYGIHTGDVKF